MLDTPTWRANADWGAQLGYSADALADANRSAAAFVEELREDASDGVRSDCTFAPAATPEASPVPVVSGDSLVCGCSVAALCPVAADAPDGSVVAVFSVGTVGPAAGCFGAGGSAFTVGSSGPVAPGGPGGAVRSVDSLILLV